MNIVKTLKSAAAISAIALSFVSAPSFATSIVDADGTLGGKTCRPGSDCTDANGPSLDGFAGTVSQAPSIQTCTKNSVECSESNGPSLDGFAGAISQAPSIQTCTKNSAECADPNGPSLDGFAGTIDGHFGQAPSIRTCTKTTAECAEPNGPSLDGFVAAARTVGKN